MKEAQTRDGITVSQAAATHHSFFTRVEIAGPLGHGIEQEACRLLHVANCWSVSVEQTHCAVTVGAQIMSFA